MVVHMHYLNGYCNDLLDCYSALGGRGRQAEAE
jgi:hypothetical protein